MAEAHSISNMWNEAEKRERMYCFNCKKFLSDVEAEPFIKRHQANVGSVAGKLTDMGYTVKKLNDGGAD